MKAAKDKEDEFYDLAEKRQHLGKESRDQRPHHRVGQSNKVRGESVPRLIVGSRLL